MSAPPPRKSERTEELASKELAQLRSELDALARSERRLRQILDSIDDLVICKDHLSRSIYANRATLEHVGLSLAQLREAGASNEFGEAEQALLRAREDDQRVMTGGAPVESDIDTHNSRGELRELHVIKTPLHDDDEHVSAIVCVARDVTLRNRIERHERFLAEASAMFSSSLDLDEILVNVAKMAVPRIADWCAIDMLDDEGDIKRVSLVHQDERKRALALDVWQRIPRELRNQWSIARVIETGQSDLVPVISLDNISKQIGDPEILDIFRELAFTSSLAVPLFAGERVVGTLTLLSSGSGSLLDSTDVKFAEELARRASTAITHAHLYRRAESAAFEREKLLNTIASEMRGPLLSILNNAGYLLRAIPDDPRIDRRRIEEVGTTAERLSNFLHSFVDMEQLRSGHVTLEKSKNDPMALVLEALDINRPRIVERRLAIVRDVASRQNITCDRRRMTQVLSRAISYAARVTPPGGRLSLSLAPAGSNLHIIIADGGPPRSRAALKAMFLPPTRETPDLIESFVVSRTIVEAHGGRMWAEPLPTVGNQIICELPLQ